MTFGQDELLLRYKQDNSPCYVLTVKYGSSNCGFRIPDGENLTCPKTGSL
jgi:hypothetical protein